MELSNREARDRAGVKMMFRLFDAQEKEVKEGMVRFDGSNDDPYSIKIEDDSHGYLVCRITLRKGGQLLYRLRFRKKPKLGVIYNFRDCERLNRLWIEEDLFPELLLLPAQPPSPPEAAKLAVKLAEDGE